MSVDELIKECSTYGHICESNGKWIYDFDEELIRDEKWKRLSKEQQDSLYDFWLNGGNEEEWYKENAKGIWDYVEEQAGLEEDYAVEIIHDIELEEKHMQEDDCLYNRIIDREYHKDRI